MRRSAKNPSLPLARIARDGTYESSVNDEIGRSASVRRGARSRNIVGRYERSWGARSMPSFLSRLRRVLGWRPRRVAAPFGPSITQPVCPRTLRMWLRSTSSRARRGPAAVAETGSLRTSGPISSVGPVARMTARSRIFSSSRTLPGQE